jgi:hypothetical protein
MAVSKISERKDRDIGHTPRIAINASAERAQPG